MDYDMIVHYHPGKANVVEDALRRLTLGSVAHVEEERKKLVKDVNRLARLGVCLMSISDSGVTVQNESGGFLPRGDGLIRYKGRLCVPNVGEFKHHILAEAHNFRYSIHPGATKMYHNMREIYWWNDMKRDIADFVSKYPNWQQDKVEH
ncbi:uncharacterized protein [Solanum lycopersicum]|uniref:uncharacterized protein n=1 Tax=Solanum lycopersicum TaxID=4081 RepID=UPI00374A911C